MNVKDLHKYPYRGILAEIARERGVTRQAIAHSAKRGNLVVLEMILQKIKEREEKLKSFRRIDV